MNPFRDVEQLEDALSEPTEGAIETAKRLDGDIMILGVGGKMGPTLARMTKKAIEKAGKKARVIGVSRFSTPALPDALHKHGIETISCDLLNQSQLDKLPDAPNIIYMAGMKFGSTGKEALTWAMNCYLPGMVSQKYRKSKIVAFSTGNVYGLSPVKKGGSVETDFPNPIGDYATSCLGRERIFEHFSRTLDIPMAILRLNYSTELRYGVLVDTAQQVWAGQPIHVGMGYFNAIWQAEANAMTIQSFDHVATPPRILNIVGTEIIRVRDAAERLGKLMGKSIRVEGTESEDAILGNGQLGHKLMGKLNVTADQMMEWIADWIMKGGETLGKPTHFEVRDGKF